MSRFRYRLPRSPQPPEDDFTVWEMEMRQHEGEIGFGRVPLMTRIQRSLTDYEARTLDVQTVKILAVMTATLSGLFAVVDLFSYP